MKLDNVISVRKNKVLYRDGEDCVKVFNEFYSKSDVLREALNQSMVESIGLNVPEIKEVCTIDGKWAIRYRFIEGVTLQELMDAHPEKKEEYINRLVDIQLEITSKTASHLIKLKDKMQAKISQTTLDATTRYELHTRLDSMPKHHKVCHGDLNPSNIIITPNDEAYIIDWSHVTQGNASADAARTYLLFHLHGDKEAAEIYLNAFCKKSDTAKQYVQRWMPIVAASQSVKAIEGEREFLLSWADVCEYE